MFTRRELLKTSVAFGGGFVLANTLGRWTYAQTALLDATSHPKFQTLLPKPARIDATNGGQFDIQIRETNQFVGLFAANGRKLTTYVWGYSSQGQAGVTYPGATFVAKKDVPVYVQWNNKLPKGKKGGHLLPIDLSIHLAQPTKRTIQRGANSIKNTILRRYIPTVTHLHGGHTESASDGLPEAWFVQDFAETGPDWVKKTYTYANDQEGAILWYHDHALGITRLNVYAGLAGFYLLRDDNELQLIRNGVLPSGNYERELVIQDRMFTADGQLFYPAAPPEPDFLDCGQQLTPVPNPSVLPEFFGNFILVNGAAWPVLDVEPRKYRFRLLNGSDSRFYILQFSNGMRFYQVGTDGGFLFKPVELEQLLIAPGERADFVVDFAEMANQEIILQNLGPDGPFSGLGSSNADSQTTGLVMKFNVNKPKSSEPDAPGFTPNVTLRSGDKFAVPGSPQTTRKLVLFEGRDPYGRLRPQLGTLDDGSLLWDEANTENPKLNDVEIWEVYNTTADAHPIHLHLVSFEILNRQNFTANGVFCTGQDPMEGGTKLMLNSPTPTGSLIPPDRNELGPKDTVIMYPGQITRIKAKFDRSGQYVWHCHILSHEDHEMMRPYFVG